MLVTKFNYEEKAIENIQESIAGTELTDFIIDYYVPIKYTKERIKLADGEFKTKIHKTKGALSNYIFVKCILTETVWNLLRTTSGVAVIPTVGGFPVPISEQELNKIKEQQKPEGFTDEEIEKLEKKKKRIIK
jgi:transcription antitermination factor NusG